MTEHARPDHTPARDAESKAWSAFITHAAVCKGRCRTHGEDCETAAELRTVWRAARAEVVDQDRP